MTRGKCKSQYRRRGGLYVKKLSNTPNLHIMGTLRIGERSETVKYSTRLHHMMPGAWEAAETMRVKKEKEILDRILYNRPPPRPMEDLVSDYLAQHDYCYQVKLIAKEIAKAFKGVLVGDLDRARIETHFRKRFREHERGGRYRHETVLHAMFALAQREGSLYQIPYWNRVKYKAPKSENAVKRFHPGEVELLIECADVHIRPIIAVMYATGARAWQTINLRRENVELERGRGRVFFLRTKNGHSYVRPLHDYAVDQICMWLLRRHDDYPQLFLTPSRRPYVQNAKGGGHFWHGFRSARDRCAAELHRRGYPERARRMAQATPHWLRHSFANNLRQIYGMDARGIADAGMWEDVQNVDRTYIVSAPEVVEEQVRRMPLGVPLGSKPSLEPEAPLVWHGSASLSCDRN
ncbi:tyrosine-type recombinase/integrase [Pelagibius sp.]|uniref:tyrosine-type recombinase/integrase n=1 Tax=Pelagibius sp. TaxID=1931238 RepID=UPI003BB0F419